MYSYTYVADAVSAILYILLNGECGQAYNIASEKSDKTLKEIAQILADKAEVQLMFELPNEKEAQGYSKATKALLDVRKLEELGWRSLSDIELGLCETVDILRYLD